MDAYHAAERVMSAPTLTRRMFAGGFSIRYAPIAGIALVAVGAALWGFDSALRQPLLNTWSPWTIVLYEHVILVALVGYYVISHRASLRNLDRMGWISLIVIAWGGSALATLAFTTAFEYGNPNVVVLLQKTQPLWAILAAAIVVREVPRPVILIVFIPAAIGTYLLSFGWLSPSDAFSDGRGKAALLALIAAALWGSATAFGRRALQQIDSNLVTGMRFVLALPFLFVLVLARGGGELTPSGAAGSDWVRLFLLALFPGLIALLLYYRGLKTTPAPVATFAELAFPATTLIVNYFYLGYTIDVWQFVGLVVLWVTIAALHLIPVMVPARPSGGSRATPAVSAAG
jgi:drug/metabolite transporter (DMT)-like permease